MSGRTPWRKDYVPYLLDFPHIPPPFCYRCPYGQTHPDCHLSCADELDRVITQEGSEYISAFIAEPILGTSASGVTPPPDYYPAIREICNRHNVLLIIDEVVTGFGRTGLNFGIDHWGVTPDIMATGKGLRLLPLLSHMKGYMTQFTRSQYRLHTAIPMEEIRSPVLLPLPYKTSFRNTISCHGVQRWVS